MRQAPVTLRASASVNGGSEVVTTCPVNTDSSVTNKRTFGRGCWLTVGEAVCPWGQGAYGTPRSLPPI